MGVAQGGVLLAGEAASGQVMLLADAVICEAQRLWTACTEARLPLLPDVASRLRSLMLSVARLSEGELLRRTTDLQASPGAAWGSLNGCWLYYLPCWLAV